MIDILSSLNSIKDPINSTLSIVKLVEANACEEAKNLNTDDTNCICIVSGADVISNNGIYCVDKEPTNDIKATTAP